MSSSRTIKGAFMLATLPERASKTCKLRRGYSSGSRSWSPLAPSPFERSLASVAVDPSVDSVAIFERCERWLSERSEGKRSRQHSLDLYHSLDSWVSGGRGIERE